MVNYSNGKIYKIVSNHTDLIYIGSTAQQYLSQRKTTHNSYKKCSSKEILKYDDAEIILIEKYSCNCKDELSAREQYYIDKFRADGFNVVNKNRAFGLDENRMKNNAIEYYEKNKEILKQNRKNYRQNNKEKVKQIDKKYRDNNKELLLQKNKEWFNNNKLKQQKYQQEWRDTKYLNSDKRVLEVYNFIQLLNQY